MPVCATAAVVIMGWASERTGKESRVSLCKESSQAQIYTTVQIRSMTMESVGLEQETAKSMFGSYSHVLA